MAYTERRCSSCYKRFLILLLMFFSLFAYAHSSTSTPNGIEFTVNNDTFFITEELHIDIILSKQKRAPFVFTLEEHSTYTEFIKSDTMSSNGKTALHYTYRLKKTGTLTFTPVLKTGKTRHILPSFTITVHPAPLSEATEFTWEISPLENPQRITEEDTYIQGKSYMLFLTAAFFSSQHHDDTSAAVIQPLPPELTRIKCDCPENAILEPYTPNKAERAAFRNIEKNILATFHWIPLYTGTQFLPQAKIIFANGNSTTSTAMSKSILPAKKHVSTAVKRFTATVTPSITHPAFARPDADTLNANNTEKTEIEQKKMAYTIAEYRFKELHSLFPYAVRAERKKQEALLAISKPVALYPPIFIIICAICTVLAAITAFIFLLKQMKRKFFLSFIVTCIGSIGFIALYIHAMSPKGICIESSAKAVVRQIPEHSGRTIHHLVLGESVIILEKTPQWYYIRTTTGVRGWIPQHILVVYNQKKE